MRIYRAYYDSRNFSFEAYSLNELDARAKCLEGLKTHGEQYELENDWFMVMDGVDGIECDTYQLDKAYRDRDEL